jgi:hypothetical protein
MKFVYQILCAVSIFWKGVFMVKIECYIPEEYVAQLRDALNDIGALTVDGNYDYCMAVSKVRGSWRALSGANPYMGNIGDICDAEEAKIEFNCKKELYKTAVDTIKRIHPYEKPVINVIPLIISIVERSER